MTKKSKKLTSKDESQLRKDLKKEFLHFCQTTTIRGVTRVVTARNKTLQILWIASVILFFGGLFVCMFILTRQYLEYNVIHPPQVLRDTPSPFPSLTLCNLRPLSSEANSILNKYNLKSPRQFAIDVNNFAAKAYYFSNDIHSYQQVTSAVSMGGYLESLPQIVVPKLGHNLSHTVIHCMVVEFIKVLLNYNYFLLITLKSNSLTCKMIDILLKFISKYSCDKFRECHHCYFKVSSSS
uniref:Amiloride-sensitive sodium channel n=1 Tax=Schistosoma haematobium TaxID=6185 RepID=A0A095C344_SCHHA